VRPFQHAVFHFRGENIFGGKWARIGCKRVPGAVVPSSSQAPVSFDAERHSRAWIAKAQFNRPCRPRLFIVFSVRVVYGGEGAALLAPPSGGLRISEA
jgi:hypothetical protein